jgi:uncharacterized protein (TIGR02147 family)
MGIGYTCPMATLDLFRYFDYQVFLKDWIEQERSLDTARGVRHLSRGTGIDPSLLVKIMQGKRHLSPSAAEAIIQFLQWDEREAQYFRTLISYCKAEEDDRIRESYEELLRIRRCSSLDMPESKYSYYQNWWVSAVRASLEAIPYHDPSDAAKLVQAIRFPVTVEQVHEAIRILDSLGLAKKDAGGRWLPTDLHLTTQEKWKSFAIQDLQTQFMDLTSLAIHHIPKQERDISTVTMGFDMANFEQVRDILASARDALVRLADKTPAENCNSVFQVNMGVFPLMGPIDKEEPVASH